jgi:hypothetical protein
MPPSTDRSRFHRPTEDGEDVQELSPASAKKLARYFKARRALQDGDGKNSLKLHHPAVLAAGSRLFRELCLRNPFSPQPPSEAEKDLRYWFRMFRPSVSSMRSILSAVSTTSDSEILAAGRWLGPESLARAERLVSLRSARRAHKGRDH